MSEAKKRMDREPLESDHDFRQVIGRAADARRQSSWPRRSLRSLALPVLKRPGLTFLLMFFMCLGGFFVFIFGVFIKWTDAYTCSLAEARRTRAVVAELGEPIEAGFFAWMYGYSRQGSVTDTSFRNTLAGPKGEGTLRVQWYSSPVGSSLRMELEKDGRKQLVYSGAIPCR